MRLPDLSRLRLEPLADARGADEEDATGAFAAQVEPQHIDCRADAPLSVRRQLWERFARMALRNKALLRLEEAKAAVAAERGRGDPEPSLVRQRSSRNFGTDDDEDDEDLEERMPLTVRAGATKQRHLKGVDYKDSDDGTSICTLCSSEIAGGFANGDSEDAKLQLETWNDAINTEMAYTTYPNLLDELGRPWRLADRTAPRVPVADPRLRISVPEEWKDGETCIEITNAPTIANGVCTTHGPMICYHKACVLIALKKHYDGGYGAYSPSHWAQNWTPPFPAAFDLTAFMVRAREALGEQREPNGQLTFGPPNYPHRIDWLFGPQQSGRWNYFCRPRPDGDTAASLVVAAADEAAARRRRAEGSGLGVGSRERRDALNREAPGQAAAPNIRQILNNVEYSTFSPNLAGYAMSDSSIHLMMTRMARALTLRGPVTPFPLHRSPLTPNQINRGLSGNILHLRTERCVLLNEAFPECRIDPEFMRPIRPRSGFGSVVHALRDGARMKRLLPPTNAQWFSNAIGTNLPDEWRYSEQFVHLLHPDNDRASYLEWELSTIIDGTNLATGETLDYSPQSARGIQMRTDLMASQRAASFRFYLNDMTFTRNMYALGALRVTVSVPVKLHAVVFRGDGTATPARSMISQLDAAAPRSGPLSSHEADEFRGPAFDVIIRPGFMVWADSTNATPPEYRFTTQDESMFRSDNPAWQTITDALNPTSAVPYELQALPRIDTAPGVRREGRNEPDTPYTVYDNDPNELGGCWNVSSNQNISGEAAAAVAAAWPQHFLGNRPSMAAAGGNRLEEYEKKAFETGIKMTLCGVAQPRMDHATSTRDVRKYAIACMRRVMKRQSENQISVLDAVAAHLTNDREGERTTAANIYMKAWSDVSITHYSAPDAARTQARGLSDGRANLSLTVYYERRM